MSPKFPIFFSIAFFLSFFLWGCKTYPPAPGWIKAPRSQSTSKGKMAYVGKSKYKEFVGPHEKSVANGEAKTPIKETVEDRITHLLDNYSIQLGDIQSKDSLLKKLTSAEFKKILSTTILGEIKLQSTFQDEKTSTYYVLATLATDSFLYHFQQKILSEIDQSPLSPKSQEDAKKRLRELVQKEKVKFDKRYGG